MDYKVIIAPRAVLDLEEIVRYIAEDNPMAALKMGGALMERVKSLTAWPEMGRVVPEFDDAAIRELILRPYRIVYQLDNKRGVIGIARFWHGARGIPEMK